MTQGTGTGTTDELLVRATDRAVKKSFEEIEKIKVHVDNLTKSFRSTALKVRALKSDGANKESAINFADQLEKSSDQIDDLFDRQKNALSSFNIVLFGRTGVGKSTLISAITKSNGEAVSPGESDWTVNVDPKKWHSCKIYDTPGINGWGRNNSRESLEKKAREAVEIADVVLICFDSQSQQVDEFKKVADWVQSYKKPVIAILNPRNPVWRIPIRVPNRIYRKNISGTVQQHTLYIRDELAKIGLFEVPILAINSKRALFARAELPFEGPDKIGFDKQRKKYGIALLEKWSCMPRLEHLLVETITSHAVEFRIGALNDQIHGVFRELVHSLTATKGALGKAYEGLESGIIQDLFDLLGYPSKKDDKYRRIFWNQGKNTLTELEKLRDGAFQASTLGKYHQFISQRIEAEFETIRTQSIDKAEERVIHAFDMNEEVTADEMRKLCFDDAKIKETAQGIVDEGTRYLKRNLDLAMGDTILNLEYEAKGVKVGTDAGKGEKIGSFVFKGAGILSGTVSALGAFAAINFWNPVGWTAAVATGVALIGGALATVFSWFGNKTRNNAEKNRLNARRKALADVRERIHKTYNKVIKEVTKHSKDYAIEVSKEYLVEPVKQCVMLRLISTDCNNLQAKISKLSQELRSSSEPQTKMLEVQKSIEAVVYPAQTNASLLYWLGEDWIKDPMGLQEDSKSKKQKTTQAYDSSYFDQLFSGIKDVFNRITENVKPGSGKKWLNKALESCKEDVAALEKLTELENIVRQGKPRIFLVGDYNSGKSSFIKRLLIDAGEPIPDSLKINAKPETSNTREYSWNGMKLIDSPGFQSSNAQHMYHTLNSFSNASAVIYLFQPNLILGDDHGLRTILNGEQKKGLVPKKDRTFFIINRSDELGADPEDSPETFHRLVERKKRELSLALQSRNASAKSDQIFCMSSDPFGLVGNRMEVNSMDYDSYRAWDGLQHFMEAFKAHKKKLLRIGVDRSVLEGGVALMELMATEQESKIKKYSIEESALEKLNQEFEDALSEGRRLKASREAKLKQLISEQASAFKEIILAENDKNKLEALSKHFQEWWKDEALQTEINQWAKKTAQLLNEWLERSFEKINRRIDSAEFRIIMGEYGGHGPGIKNDSKIKSFLKHTFDKIGKTFGAATRDTVYGIGKSLGFKFKPWGAVKLAKNLGKAGAVMAVVSVGYDIADLFLGEKRLKDREKKRQEIANFLNESIPKIVNAVAYSSDDDPGLLKQIEKKLVELKKIENEYTLEKKKILNKKSTAQKKLENYRTLKHDAIINLGSPWGGKL